MRKPSGGQWRILAAALGGLTLGGCAAAGGDAPSGARQVSLAEFAAPVREPVPSASATAGPEVDPPDSKPLRLGAGSPEVEQAVREQMNDAPAPDEGREILRVRKPGDTVLVDSLVGQINGRPIFADDILLPIEDQLIALSLRATSTEEFQQATAIIVRQRLRTVVRSELFLADAEAALTPEQQKGLLNFLRNLREQTVAERGGSQEQAEQKVLESEGISMDEYLERQKDEALVRDMVLRKIRARVIVSWRDIEREYQRDYDEFNPPPSVMLSRIRLRADQADVIDDVKRRLAAGDTFAEVAEAAGMPDQGLWDSFTMGPGGTTDIGINEAYKPYLKGLDVGQTTEGFEMNGRMMWLHIDSIERGEGRSLYDQDVQRQLYEQVFQRRLMEEYDRYTERLIEQSTLDDLNVMEQRAVAIALIRYSPGG